MKFFNSETHLYDHLTEIAEHYSKTIIVTDTNVQKHCGAQLCSMIETLVLPAGEEHKNLSTAEFCWTKMLESALDRKSCVIALGGGCLTDIVGFAAACYMRGIDVLYIPTTLMGMVDASVGGKTGINLSQAKNAIGIIREPKETLILPSMLNTLPEREYRSGIAEIIKYGVIADPELFEYLSHNMQKLLERDPLVLETAIRRSCQIKYQIVEKDLYENSSRWVLNWGHTFAHAIESATNYKQYLHGEAVSIGMCYAAKLSHRLGFATDKFVDQQRSICQKAGLPISVSLLPLDKVISCMKYDKKAISQKISLILAEEIGKVFKHDIVDETEITEVLKYYE